jgi:hypothetical protein
MAHTERYIKRTPEEDRRVIEETIEKTLDEVSLEDLRHKKRLESGTCYVRDLAWMWDLSTDAIRDRLDAGGVEPVSRGGRAHLYDVEEATEAIRKF